MHGSTFAHVIMWIFIGALLVLVVTHAAGFSTAVTAVGGQITNNASLLSGAGATVPGGIGTTTLKPAA